MDFVRFIKVLLRRKKLLVIISILIVPLAFGQCPSSLDQSHGLWNGGGADNVDDWKEPSPSFHLTSQNRAARSGHSNRGRILDWVLQLSRHGKRVPIALPAMGEKLRNDRGTYAV